MKKTLTVIAAASMGLALGVLSQPQTTVQAAKYHQGMPKILRGHWSLSKHEQKKAGREAGDIYNHMTVSSQKFASENVDTMNIYLSPRYKKTSNNHYVVLTHFRQFSSITKNSIFLDKQNVKVSFTLKNGRMSFTREGGGPDGLWYSRAK
ncbi:hypothetical protein [Levilactobacillus mulengensis]|uniref:hypothetical protein n=1 Tax=Levilactobacillus mulengensis TaxID=2486025 RepID=UPI000F7980EB|nr:hypothetical protein [Levilactobacillus mulengensis]